MGIIDGPFSQIRFLGASITGVEATVGWNEQSSSVTVNLVEDVDNGDKFAPTVVGAPVSLIIEGFRFDGIIQYWKKIGDFSGNPRYEVQLTDPREILSGVQVILGAFRQPVGGMPNLINAFGYYENLIGFGGGMTNEAGMFWNAPFEQLQLTPGTNQGITITEIARVGIGPAIEALTSVSNNFGSPINFRGYTYRVDLSGLPTPPSYYRLGGISRDILSMATELCQDAGYDYMVYMIDGVIKFRSVSRLYTPEIGQIANFVNGQPNVSSKSYGVELRNDVTNAVLLGGDVRQLEQVFNTSGGNTIWPYWGTDMAGIPIVGEGPPEVDHKAKLNAEEILDIMGGTEYPIDLIELRCALVDYDSWAAYVIKWWPDKADTIGLVGAIDSTNDLQALFPDVIFQHDLIAQREVDARRFGEMYESDYWTERANRVYEFVKRYAEEYFGRKFLVAMPFFVYYSVEAETGQIITSMEISSDGAFTPDGSMPLGINYLNENLFMTEDGRFECFVRFPIDEKMDLQKLSYDSVVISSGYVYMKATVDEGFVYPKGSLLPYCVVTLDSPIYERSPDPLGGIENIAAILEMDPQIIAYAASIRHGSFPLKIHPAPYRPHAAAIPTKSNRDSYGPWGTFPPWGAVGAPGKVLFNRDETMVPWNYGGYDMMNLAASAQLANASTNMQESELGAVRIVGSCDFSLGDELVAGGPNISGISLSVDASGGVTTSCDLRTFTPTFGAFSKYNADRLKRLGILSAQMRRQFRAMFQKSLAQQRNFSAMRRGFMENTSRGVRQMTPHNVLYGTMTYSQEYGYRTNVSSATPIEAFTNARPDSEAIWQATGLMTMAGLLRPFSTDNTLEMGTDPDTNEETRGSGDIPHFEDPGSITGVTCKELNPFTEDCDIDLLASGDKYPGSMHKLKPPVDEFGAPLLDEETGALKKIDFAKARLLGLRGPLIMVGWGYDLTGKPFPNETDSDLTNNVYDASDNFMDEHEKHPEHWKAGPIDLRWDKWRKVYASPGYIIEATLTQTLTGGPAKASIDGTSPLEHIKVYNGLGSSVPSGAKVYLGYNPIKNRWLVIATACTS